VSPGRTTQVTGPAAATWAAFSDSRLADVLARAACVLLLALPILLLLAMLAFAWAG
jgi:hypothetical protein